MKSLLLTTASLILAVLMHADVQGQESDGPPEMKALERLVGTWKLDQIDRVPKETRSTSIVKFELVLGGRFVQQTLKFDDKGKPTQMGMHTYDSDRRAYRYWFFMSSGFYWEPTVTWDESTQTFTFEGKVGSRRRSRMMTGTVRFSDETTFVCSLITKDDGGEIIFHTEGKCVRQN